MVPSVCKTADEAWTKWFKLLMEQAESGYHASSRDGDVVGELLNAVVEITDPTRNIVSNKIRKMPMRYAVGELLWYLSGSNKVKDIAQYSKVWENLSDNGITVNSAYGYRIKYAFGFDQLEQVKKMLHDNPNSRQAVIHIKDPVDYSQHPTKDVPCTVCLQFFIRDEKLYMTTYMRSNDIWMGFPYDVFSFCAMQVLMAMELGVEVGTYTHHAASLHLYQRDYKTACRNMNGGQPKSDDQ